MTNKSQTAQPPFIEAKDLSKLFDVSPGLHKRSLGRHVRAIDNVSFQMKPSEIVGLVGESGCGKTTLGRLLALLDSPTGGSVFLDGRDITRERAWRMKKIHQQVQMVFQDPQSSLDPLFTVRDTLNEAVKAHRRRVNTRQLNAYVGALMSMVGLDNEILDRYPRELPTGVCQRVAIARALAVEPRLIVADEPLSALDLTTSTQIIKLLSTVRNELNVAILLISHDLEVVRHLADQVMVMYLGRIVEIAPTKELLDNPRHPYSMALTTALRPPEAGKKRSLAILPGEPPSPLEPPTGCHFHPRCPYADQKCRLIEPESRAVEAHRQVKCHFDLT